MRFRCPHGSPRGQLPTICLLEHVQPLQSSHTEGLEGLTAGGPGAQQKEKENLLPRLRITPCWFITETSIGLSLITYLLFLHLSLSHLPMYLYVYLYLSSNLIHLGKMDSIKNLIKK